MHLTILSRPVAARARRMALITASVPLLTKRHHLDGRHGLDDFGGELDFQFGGCAEAGAAADHLRQAGHHAFVGVSDDQRAVAGDVIDVRIAVDVLEKASVPFPDENRRSADGFEGPDRRGNSAGHELAGLLKSCLRMDEGTTGIVGHGFAFPPDANCNLKMRSGSEQSGKRHVAIRPAARRVFLAKRIKVGICIGCNARLPATFESRGWPTSSIQSSISGGRGSSAVSLMERICSNGRPADSASVRTNPLSISTARQPVSRNNRCFSSTVETRWSEA